MDAASTREMTGYEMTSPERWWKDALFRDRVAVGTDAEREVAEDFEPRELAKGARDGGEESEGECRTRCLEDLRRF